MHRLAFELGVAFEGKGPVVVTVWLLGSLSEAVSSFTNPVAILIVLKNKLF
jgi:hypothetical protein